ncbi:MAG: hypothetical protein LBK25_03900 [Treponema sp.]|nr:hypothetical protein [Treponema sp.]
MKILYTNIVFFVKGFLKNRREEVPLLYTFSFFCEFFDFVVWRKPILLQISLISSEFRVANAK